MLSTPEASRTISLCTWRRSAKRRAKRLPTSPVAPVTPIKNALRDKTAPPSRMNSSHLRPTRATPLSRSVRVTPEKASKESNVENGRSLARVFTKVLDDAGTIDVRYRWNGPTKTVAPSRRHASPLVVTLRRAHPIRTAKVAESLFLKWHAARDINTNARTFWPGESLRIWPGLLGPPPGAPGRR